MSDAIPNQVQENFAQAYVETGNASEAYRRAYPRSKKWQPQSVHVKASELHAQNKVSIRLGAHLMES